MVGGLPELLELVTRQILEGIEYIQIREKDVAPRELVEFVREVLLRRGTHRSKILVNERADIAAAAGADGVHLPGYAPQITLPGLIIARSCHTIEEVASTQADFVTFSPIFASPGKGAPQGVDLLREACRRSSVPVFALGGVSFANANACMAAGAAGVAGIRLFL